VSPTGGIVGSHVPEDSGKWKKRHGATLKVVRRNPRQIQTTATVKKRICSSLGELN
jgi:hypothetical protein